MKKITGVLAVLLAGAGIFTSNIAMAAPRKVANAQKVEAPTTRNDAVIFKIHDVVPTTKEGIVTGCDFTVTLYNRTSINFRNFTLNLKWNDSVDETFDFDKYVKSVLGTDTSKQEEAILGDEGRKQSLATNLTISAFGSNKQISINSHLNNEKCYLLLNNVTYTVAPCDIARTSNSTEKTGFSGKECTPLFQLVDTSNPEYFGEFKNISATELAAQNQQTFSQELSDIDVVINKIIENLGVSDKTLTNIN